MTKCWICEAEDAPANLSKVSAAQGAVVHAHERCIDRHNKTVEKNQRAFDASTVADYVRAHDLDATNDYVVAKFLRERGPELRKSLLRPNPKFDQRFIDEVVVSARERRDRDHMTGVFERLEKGVAAWGAEPNQELVADITEDLGLILDRLAHIRDDSNWRRNDVIETEAARCAALLLIGQVAWRKFQAELEAGHAEYLKSEASDEAALFREGARQ